MGIKGMASLKSYDTVCQYCGKFQERFTNLKKATCFRCRQKMNRKRAKKGYKGVTDVP